MTQKKLISPKKNLKQIRSKFSVNKYLWFGVFACFGVTHAQANISYELNSLLNSVFGEETTTPDFEPIKVEQVTIPDSPTSNDWVRFTERVTAEQNNLSQFSAKMVDLQAEIYELANQQKGLEREVTLLDGELTLAEKNLAQLTQQETKWKTELDIRNAELKRLKSEQKDVIKGYKRFLQTNYLRNNRLTTDETVDMVQWLLGNNSAAQIQEQNLIRQQYAHQQKDYLQELNSIGNDIGSKQRIADNLYSKISPLRTEAQLQKETLANLTKSKAKRLQSQNSTLTQKKSQLDALERERNATKAFLQNLKQSSKLFAKKIVENQAQPNPENTPIGEAEKNIPAALMPKSTDSKNQNIETATQIPETKSWQAPLKIPLKITAQFKDQDYQIEFEREHLGTDFLAPQGTALYAPKSGTVARTYLDGYDYGYVIIDHGENIYTLYGHVSAILIDEGDYIVQGQKFALTGGAVGTMGAGPWSTGAHLHLEVFKDENHVDPVEFLGLITE
jgi:murein DD-endopeptidase MepM/ murein hydrolase activator NlpD